MTLCCLSEWDKPSDRGNFLNILSKVLTKMLMKFSLALFTLLDSLSESVSLANNLLGGDSNNLINEIFASNSLVSFRIPLYESGLIPLTLESKRSEDCGQTEATISKRRFRDISFEDR
jgi:hypothetical protein